MVKIIIMLVKSGEDGSTLRIKVVISSKSFPDYKYLHTCNYILLHFITFNIFSSKHKLKKDKITSFLIFSSRMKLTSRRIIFVIKKLCSSFSYR